MRSTYLVASPEFWDSIPQDFQLICGRVRFTQRRYDPPPGTQRFDDKAAAVAALAPKLQLVRESCRAPDRWQYQLLIDVNR